MGRIEELWNLIGSEVKAMQWNTAVTINFDNWEIEIPPAKRGFRGTIMSKDPVAYEDF